jgi:alkylation response protein AidB-like acyl-CoA dehydrogenase
MSLGADVSILNEEQRMLSDAVGRLLAQRCEPARVRECIERASWDADLWGEMAALGLHGMRLPEAAGGTGSAVADWLIVARLMGRHMAPVPFVQSGACVSLLAALDLSAATERAGDILSGALRLAFPLDATHLDWPTTSDDGTQWVAYGAAATHLLVSRAVAGGRVGVWLVPQSELNSKARGSVDLSAPLTEVQVPSELGEALIRVDAESYNAAHSRAKGLAMAALCAQLLGNAESTLAPTLEHLKTRQQFGRPIGAFQAVQHQAADMGIRLEGMRAFYDGLLQLPTLRHDNSLLLMAKPYMSDGGHTIAQTCMQLYGGMGFTWENDVHFQMRYAMRCGQMLGSAASLRSAAIQGRTQ